MADIYLRCLDCHASLSMRPPDSFGVTEDGITLEIPVDATNIAFAIQATVAYMCEHGCPSCGGHDLDLAADEN